MDQGLPVLEAGRTRLKMGLYIQARTSGCVQKGQGGWKTEE